VDVSIGGELPDVNAEVKKPKGSFHFDLPKFSFGGKETKTKAELSKGGPDAFVNVEAPSVNVELKTPNVGHDIEVVSTSPTVSSSRGHAGIVLPSVEVSSGANSADGDDKTKKSKGFFIELPQLGFGASSSNKIGNIRGSLGAGSPTAQSPSSDSEAAVGVDIDGREGLHDSRGGSLGRKMKGLFSSKRRKKPNLSAEGGAHVDATIRPPDVNAEGSFATSYDATLAAHDVQASARVGEGSLTANTRDTDTASPSARLSGEPGARTSSSLSSSDGNTSPTKFGGHLRFGSSKSKKPRRRIEEGLKCSLATAGMAAGSVQISPELFDSSQFSESHSLPRSGVMLSTSGRS